jgi:cellulose synthase/poly-beta-1,6-N-acetylglucosamine synthase-like glycosyltransferase
MLNYIALIALLSIFYSYFGYFLLLQYFKKNKTNKTITEVEEPKTISIIIAAKNEELHIEEKILNTLSLNAWDKSVKEELLSTNPRIEVIVADDSSTDRTLEIVQLFKDSGVLISSSKDNKGKEVAQREAVLLSTSEIILFTDTKVILNEDIIHNTLKYYKNASVGVVSSTDCVIDNDNKSGEGAYVKYEMKLRDLESEVNSLVGLSGSCFSARRTIATKIEAGIPSDFTLLMQAIKFGYKGIIAPDVIGSYQAVKDIDKEFKRKVRTVLRGMTALASHSEMLDISKYGFFSVQLISHKLYRWLVPWFLIILFISSFIMSSCSSFWSLIFFGQLALVLLALCGKYAPNSTKYLAVKISLFFIVSNLAILIAGIKFIQGKQIASWEPSKKG